MNFSTSDSLIAITFDPINTNIVYFGGGAGSIFKSTTGGSSGSWTYAGPGVLPTTASGPVRMLVIDSSNSQNVYAATATGIFASSNGSLNWSQKSSGISLLHVYSICVNPNNPALVYAGTEGGLFKSTNGGVS